MKEDVHAKGMLYLTLLRKSVFLAPQPSSVVQSRGQNDYQSDIVKVEDPSLCL